VKAAAGMVVSPVGGERLGACSPRADALRNNDPRRAEIRRKSRRSGSRRRLLAEEPKALLYLAQQGNAGPAQGSNPFNTLLAGYIVVEGSVSS